MGVHVCCPSSTEAVVISFTITQNGRLVLEKSMPF